MTVYGYAHSTPLWWKNIEAKISRARNITVWQVDSDDSRALAALAKRTMQLQFTVQDGTVWIHADTNSIEVHMQQLSTPRK